MTITELSTVASNEVYTADNSPVVPHVPRGVNVSKLVLHNLTQPMLRRISRANLQRKVNFAARRGALVALHATIHAECESARQAIRATEAALDAI